MSHTSSRLWEAVHKIRGAQGRRRTPRFRPSPLEQFEDRVVMSVQLIPYIPTSPATASLTSLVPGDPNSLFPLLNVTATVPKIVGNNVVLSFTNNGTQPVNIGVTTYLTAGTTAPANLPAETYVGVVYTGDIAPGHSATILEPLHACVQLDAFIYQVNDDANQTYPAPKTLNSSPNPPIEGGYNTGGANPLGTLVSYALTSGPGGLGNPQLGQDPNNGIPNDTCASGSLSGNVTTTCQGDTEPLSGITVTMTGKGPNGPFTLTTTTNSQGNYSFSLASMGPNAVLPATNVTVSVPVMPLYTAGTISVGTVDGTTDGTASSGTTTEQIGTIALNYDDTVGVNYNFNEKCASTGPLVHGDTATIGFWHNRNGQALLDSLNGGPGATNLGNWLATTLPNLYGATANPTFGTNLAGYTNAQVAAYFIQIFGQTGQAKQAAQVLAGAFAVYVTNSTLAGGTMAAGYGFTVSSQFGTGTVTYNVGNTLLPYGGPTGLVNVSDLLEDFNDAFAGGNTPSAAEINAYESIFNNINQGGDISG